MNSSMEKRENRNVAPERLNEASYYTPLVDITETNDAFIFQADLPGVKADALDVNYENGVLTIDGKVPHRQQPQQRFLWQEYGVGNFHRSFTIDTPVNVDAIKAELKNGELILTLPKSEAVKSRKIQVQGS